MYRKQSSTRLAERGMTVLDDGSIHDEHGEVLFPPSFATAVDAILTGSLAGQGGT